MDIDKLDKMLETFNRHKVARVEFSYTRDISAITFQNAETTSFSSIDRTAAPSVLPALNLTVNHEDKQEPEALLKSSDPLLELAMNPPNDVRHPPEGGE